MTLRVRSSPAVFDNVDDLLVQGVEGGCWVEELCLRAGLRSPGSSGCASGYLAVDRVGSSDGTGSSVTVASGWSHVYASYSSSGVAI